MHVVLLPFTKFRILFRSKQHLYLKLILKSNVSFNQIPLILDAKEKKQFVHQYVIKLLKRRKTYIQYTCNTMYCRIYRLFYISNSSTHQHLTKPSYIVKQVVLPLWSLSAILSMQINYKEFKPPYRIGRTFCALFL